MLSFFGSTADLANLRGHEVGIPAGKDPHGVKPKSDPRPFWAVWGYSYFETLMMSNSRKDYGGGTFGKVSIPYLNQSDL